MKTDDTELPWRNGTRRLHQGRSGQGTNTPHRGPAEGERESQSYEQGGSVIVRSSRRMNRFIWRCNMFVRWCGQDKGGARE